MSYDLQELLVLLTERSVYCRPSHIPDISQSDISHAMGKLAAKYPESALLLEVKYCWSHKPSDNPKNGIYPNLVKELDIKMHLAVLDLWLEKRWPRPKTNTWYMKSLGQLALAEHIWPNQCYSCGGTRVAIKDNLLVDCPECEGRGIKHKTDEYRGKLLRFKDWPKFTAIYRRIQDIPRTWEQDGVRKLRKILGLWPYST